MKRTPFLELWWSSRRGRTERSDGRPRRGERYCRGTSCVARDAWLRVAALSRTRPPCTPSSLTKPGLILLARIVRYDLAFEIMNRATRTLINRVSAPPAGDAFATWVMLEDATHLLRADLDHDDIILYCSTGDVFMHAILVPSDVVTPPDAADLMHWSGNPYDSWGVVYSFDPPKASIESPLAHSPSKTIAGGEQLVFARRFVGVSDENSIELLQKLAHLYGLYYLEERSAYCRLDGRGDLEDVVAITRTDASKTHSAGGIIVTIRRSVIDEYMAITGTTMVRMFDITRCNLRSFGGWTGDHDPELTTDDDLIYRRHVEPQHAGYMRGVQIVSSRLSKDDAAAWSDPQDPRARKYESFIAMDWKNGIVREISTEPGQTANYFTQSMICRSS